LRARNTDALFYTSGELNRLLVFGAQEPDKLDILGAMFLHAGATPVSPARFHGKGDIRLGRELGQ